MRKFVLLIMAVLVTGSLFAQNRRVSGVVTGDSGEPIIGAVVIVQGTTTSTVTNADGHYSVSAPAGGTLEFSSLGYVGQQVAVGGRATIDVTMQADAQQIDDVIVVAFGTATRESFTGSAGVMGADAIEKRTSTNVVNSLAGQVPGVQIRGFDGQPGESSTIRVRGFTSIMAENDPLIIVDGAPYPGNLSTISPSDIQSLTVLKDASSTALYGARAANGVVMITTKRGTRQEAVINFDAKVGVGTRAAIDYDYIKDPATHYELVHTQFYNYAQNVGGYDDARADTYANSNMMSVLRYNVYDTNGEPLIVNHKLNSNAKLGNVSGDYYLLPDDWQKEAFKNSLRQEYNVNISGGSDRASYYLSLGYLNEEGIVEKSSFDRLTARFKGDFQVKKWLKVGANMAYTNTNSSFASGYDVVSGLSSGNVFAFTSRIAPIYPLYIRDAETKQIMIDERGMQMYDYGDGTVAPTARPFLSGGNPVGAILLDDDSNSGNLLNLTGFAEATIIEGLKLNVTATNYLFEKRHSNFTNPYYGQYASSGGTIIKQHDRWHGVNIVETLSYGKRIDRHNFDIMLGHENYTYKDITLYGVKDHMFGTDIHELSAAINLVDTSSNAVNYNTEGYFIRGQYDFDGKYFASASFRRDATSRFHPDHRWGNFWSIGGAWLINHENFLSDVSWIDMLKLKVSYGTVGNDNIGDFRYVDNYEIVPSNDGVSVIPRNRGNKEITWETKASFNVGVEFDLFKNRLSGSIEYYSTTTRDLLFTLPTPESTGFPSYYDNIGDMRNAGVELNLQGVALRTKDLNLSIFANVTYNKNKILKLPPERITETQNGFPSGSYFYTEGGSMYDWNMREYAGVDPDTGESLWYVVEELDAHMNPIGEKTTTNNYNEATMFRQGSAMPNVYGGFGFTFNFYGFDLSASFDYQIGGLTYDSAYADGMRSLIGVDGLSFHKDMLNSWTPDNKSSDIPRLQFNDQYNSSMSTRFLTDASYLNFQNVNLGYTFPAKWTNKIKISSIRIYCTAENIIYWSKRKGLDPRQYFDGTSLNHSYSPIRTISGGLQLTF